MNTLLIPLAVLGCIFLVVILAVTIFCFVAAKQVETDLKSKDEIDKERDIW